MDNKYSWMIDHYSAGLEHASIAKILWGNRSIYKRDWVQLKKFLAVNNIKTVIEYGVGLSTELMQLEGIEVVSLETLDWWAKICKRVIGNEIIIYEHNKLPEINRKFDLAFVDGPQTRREHTIEHAKDHSDIIYMHDLRQMECLEDWHIFEPWGNHFYVK